MSRTGEIKSVEGLSGLREIIEDGRDNYAVKDYAAVIRDCSIIRSLITASGQTLNDCYQTILDVPEVVCDAEQRIFAVSERDSGVPVWELGTVVVEANARLAARMEGQASGILTGFADIDARLGGLRPGQLVVIAARPSMGKTALAMAIAANIAIRKKEEGQEAVLFVSLEMGRNELVDRLICTLASVDSQRYQDGTKLSPEEKMSIANASNAILEAPILIDENPSQTITKILSSGRKQKRKRNIGLIVVDYLQLIDSPQSAGNRQEEVSKISRGLKTLARHINVPVIVLSQLNRKCEERPDKRPQLADLRESGAIEQDADVVMLLFREGHYDSQIKHGISEVQIAKNRNGPTGLAKLYFEKRFTRFSNLTYEQEREHGQNYERDDGQPF